MKRTRMMAFWGYDLFPYYIWGEIDKNLDVKMWKGKISYYITSYQGYFVPDFILPYNDGVVLGDLLDELKYQKKEAQDRLNREYKEHLNRILKEQGVGTE